MLQITITYKNGNTITDKTETASIAYGKFCYTPSINPHPIFVRPVMIPLENIEHLDVKEM